MYQIKREPYLNKNTENYEYVLSIDRFPDNNLNVHCARKCFPKLSPFKENVSSCKTVFKDNNNNLLTDQHIPQLLNILDQNGYQIDYELSKIIKDKDSLFWIKRK